MKSRSWAPLYTVLAAAGLLALSSCAAWKVNRAVEMARDSEALQQTPVAPALRLLIVGDSTAARTGAIYVKLFHERADDPFVANPHFHAADGLHPRDAGYLEWFSALQSQAALAPRDSVTRGRRLIPMCNQTYGNRCSP